MCSQTRCTDPSSRRTHLGCSVQLLPQGSALCLALCAVLEKGLDQHFKLLVLQCARSRLQHTQGAASTKNTGQQQQQQQQVSWAQHKSAWSVALQCLTAHCMAANTAASVSGGLLLTTAPPAYLLPGLLDNLQGLLVACLCLGTPLCHLLLVKLLRADNMIHTLLVRRCAGSQEAGRHG
jgi:hypothetical protein